MRSPTLRDDNQLRSPALRETTNAVTPQARSACRGLPFLLCRTPAGHDAVVDVAARQLLERAGGQLLVPTGGAAGELVQRACILGGHEDAEVLVRGMLGDFDRCE